MTTNITTTARRIAREHNDRIIAGFSGNGFLIFHADGTGGAWYNYNSRPALLQGDIKVNIRNQCITELQAQEILDNA